MYIYIYKYIYIYMYIYLYMQIYMYIGGGQTWSESCDAPERAAWRSNREERSAVWGLGYFGFGFRVSGFGFRV